MSMSNNHYLKLYFKAMELSNCQVLIALDACSKHCIEGVNDFLLVRQAGKLDDVIWQAGIRCRIDKFFDCKKRSIIFRVDAQDGVFIGPDKSVGISPEIEVLLPERMNLFMFLVQMAEVIGHPLEKMAIKMAAPIMVDDKENVLLEGKMLKDEDGFMQSKMPKIYRSINSFNFASDHVFDLLACL